MPCTKWSFDVHSRWGRASRMSQWILFVIIFLVVIRIALPGAVKAYVNHKLNEAKDYTGKIGDVDMKLWRGGYRIRQIQILRKAGNVQSPLFSAPEIDLSVEWWELFHGTVVGKAILWQPHIDFVPDSNDEQNQNGKNESWGKMFESLFPFKLNRVEIFNGEIHF
jgi:uncharacterized protein involved in outer membrane biogenesis